MTTHLPYPCGFPHRRSSGRLFDPPHPSRCVHILSGTVEKTAKHSPTNHLKRRPGEKNHGGRLHILAASARINHRCQKRRGAMVSNCACIPQRCDASVSQTSKQPKSVPPAPKASLGGITALNGKCPDNFTSGQISLLTFQPRYLVKFDRLR